MTVFNVALTNLVMWTRDHYFPEIFAHATWLRLAPFFHLPELVVQGATTVCVEQRPFNDRQYNRDLVLLCERVNTAAARLSDRRRLQFMVCDMSRPILDMQKHQVACLLVYLFGKRVRFWTRGFNHLWRNGRFKSGCEPSRNHSSVTTSES